MNSWHNKLGGRRKAGNTASQFSIGIHFLIHYFLATRLRAVLHMLLFMSSHRQSTHLNIKKKRCSGTKLIWRVFNKAIKPCDTHNWHMEGSPATHGHGNSGNHLIVLISFIGPRTRRNMTKLFHGKQRSMPNTNHFSVSLLILSLLLIPKL